MWVCVMNADQLRTEMDADDFEDYLTNLEARRELEAD
jgi:hypothetical protein